MVDPAKQPGPRDVSTSSTEAQPLSSTVMFPNSTFFAMLLSLLKSAVKLISSETGHVNHAELLQAMSVLFIGLAVPVLARSHQYATVVMANVQMEMASLLSVLVFSVRLYVRELRSLWDKFAGSEACIFSTIVVLTAFAQLIVIDASYIIISPVFAIVVIFIVTLQRRFKEKGDGCRVDEVVPLIFLTVFPYNLLWWEVILRMRGDGLVLSHFLLFLCSALGAVAVMVSSLKPSSESRAAAEVLHKTCTVVLTVTVHTMVAEQLGEDMVFACMPELTAMLLWFTVHPDHLDIFIQTLNRQLRSMKVRLFILSSAIGILAFLISMYGNESKILLSWYRARALNMFILAVLSFFDLWMLYQWPGSIFRSEGPNLPTWVLMVSGIFFFTTATMLALIPLAQWVADSVSHVTGFTSFIPQLVLGSWLCLYCLLFAALLRSAFNLFRKESPQKEEASTSSNK